MSGGEVEESPLVESIDSDGGAEEGSSNRISDRNGFGEL